MYVCVCVEEEGVQCFCSGGSGKPEDRMQVVGSRGGREGEQKQKGGKGGA